MKRLLFLFGTRPEAIKMAPLVHAFKETERYTVKVAVTAQHREMLDQVLRFFEIQPDYDLNLMQPNQSLIGLLSRALSSIEPVLDDFKPDYVFVQGDTTSVLAGGLAAFHKKIKVVHVEAGLRSFDKYSPFPEEMNRLLSSRLADIHLTPTPLATQNLKGEGIVNRIVETGNSVIDALLLGLEKIKKNEEPYRNYFQGLDFSKRILLVTCHRRENFGEPFQRICKALLELATNNPTVEIVYPVHLNPNIQNTANELLIAPNIKLMAPLEYDKMIFLMNKSFLVLTDSGGVQEEAPTLGKPVLVLRDVTERTEGISAGTAKLVGTEQDQIVNAVQALLDNEQLYAAMAEAVNPYGDGKAAIRTIAVIDSDQVH